MYTFACSFACFFFLYKKIDTIYSALKCNSLSMTFLIWIHYYLNPSINLKTIAILYTLACPFGCFLSSCTRKSMPVIQPWNAIVSTWFFEYYFITILMYLWIFPFNSALKFNSLSMTFWIWLHYYFNLSMDPKTLANIYICIPNWMFSFLLRKKIYTNCNRSSMTFWK